MGFTHFSDFTRSSADGRTVWRSPVITAPEPCDEVVATWNTQPGVALKVDIQPILTGRHTNSYCLGIWSDPGSGIPRGSVPHQQDEVAKVLTDTLVFAQPVSQLEVAITFLGTNPPPDDALKFFGLSLWSKGSVGTNTEPNRAARGRTLEVPERRQGEYPEGGGWCSPTSLSMVLAFWSQQLHRPDLTLPVPTVAAGVFDPIYQGTGNWSFNVAYAGSFPGMRAYVTRLDDLGEVEDWIAAGSPVMLSVSSYLIRNELTGPDEGHLIVAVGFTKDGDLVANDPGVSVKHNQRPRRVFPRDEVEAAWRKSNRTVYLIYPESFTPPPGRAGHWLTDK